MALVQTLAFAKSSVPSMLCGAQPIPVVQTSMSIVSVKKKDDDDKSESDWNAFALFAAGVDGHLCSWELSKQLMERQIKQPSGSLKVGKVGLFDFFVKPVRGDQSGGAGASSSSSTFSYPCAAFAFAQDGNLHIIRCVDAEGKIVLGRTAPGQGTVTVNYANNVNLLKEKKISMKCMFMSDDVFGLVLTTKQRKTQQQLQFTQVQMSSTGKVALKRLQSFNLRNPSPPKRSPSSKKSKSDAIELKVYSLSSSTSGRMIIGTNYGLVAMRSCLNTASSSVVLYSTDQAATVVTMRNDTHLVIEQVIMPSHANAIQYCPKNIQNHVALPSAMMEGMGLKNVILDYSASGKFLSVISMESHILGLYAFVQDQEGKLALIPIEHQLGSVHHFAWHPSDDCTFAYVGPSHCVQFVNISAGSESADSNMMQPRFEVNVVAQDQETTTPASPIVLSLAKGPCLGIMVRERGESKEELKFLPWDDPSNGEGFAIKQGNLDGVYLPDHIFMKWSSAVHFATGDSVSFCAIGFSNAVVMLAFNSNSRQISFLGHLKFDSPLGCLWHGTTLFVNTESHVYVAFFSGAQPIKASSVPVKMRGVHGLIDVKCVTEYSTGALSQGRYSMLSYCGGRILCATDHRQIFALDILNTLDRLKVEAESNHFLDCLTRMENALTTKDKQELFYFLCQKRNLANFPRMLSYAPSKLEQAWGLYMSEPLKALQLIIHYMRAIINEACQNEAALTKAFQWKLDTFLCTCKQMYHLIKDDFSDAKEKVEQCLMDICHERNTSTQNKNGSKKCRKAVVECIVRTFGNEEEPIQLPESAMAKDGRAELERSFFDKAKLYS